MLDPNRQKTGVVIIEVIRSNGNGDPDRGGMPRVMQQPDGEYRLLMSEFWLKRRIRDFANRTHGVSLYVARNAVPSEVQKGFKDKFKVKGKDKGEGEKAAMADLLGTFWDARVFGAPLTQFNQGRILGPMQFSMGISVLPLPDMGMEMGMTRVTGERKMETNEDGKEEDTGRRRANMGHRALIRHAVVTFPFFYSAAEGKVTGVTERDLEIFWDSLLAAVDNDKATNRTGIILRGVYAFEHRGMRTDVPTHKLLDRVKIRAREGVEYPFSWSDYELSFDGEGLPSGLDAYVIGDDKAGFDREVMREAKVAA